MPDPDSTTTIETGELDILLAAATSWLGMCGRSDFMTYAERLARADVEAVVARYGRRSY